MTTFQMHSVCEITKYHHNIVSEKHHITSEKRITLHLNLHICVFNHVKFLFTYKEFINILLHIFSYLMHIRVYFEQVRTVYVKFTISNVKSQEKLNFMYNMYILNTFQIDCDRFM